MNLLILASGGDAPGMNACLYEICMGLKKHNLFASLYGFRGLVENKITPVNLKKLQAESKKAGVLYKTSRCEEFKTQLGFKKALKNLEKNKIDVVVILGGDGSFKGAKELVNNGIKVIFIPSTIDNDMPFEVSCIGFNTAVNACLNYINNVMPSMEAFDRGCVFEVMGRNNPSICKCCGERADAGLVIVSQQDTLTIDFNKNSNIVILQENLLNKDVVAKRLEEKYGFEFKSASVGYVQRGTAPTKEEIKLCKSYAKLAIKAIKAGAFPCLLNILNSEQTIIPL